MDKSKFQVEVYDINNWNAQVWNKPQKGSSPIIYFENPDTYEHYFFKESHGKYPPEFWSEVISSKLGQSLGFNVLDYNVALYQGRLGCISKQMLQPDKQELYHGVDVLNDHLKSFILSDKPTYSYQDIVSMSKANPFFGNLLHGFNKMILFDAFIGNGDRHLENWALLVDYDVKIGEVIKKKKQGISFLKTVKSFFSGDAGLFFNDGDSINPTELSRYTFSPIYDSGSCLGRELTDVRIKQMFTDKVMFDAYLNRSKSEIRWNNNQITHFDLVENLLKENGLDNSDKLILSPALYNFDETAIKDLVNNADKKVQSLVKETSLSDVRKEFLFKLICARVERLKKIAKNG